MANALTISRLFFLALCISLLYVPGPTAKLGAFLLVIFVLVLDGLDGPLARQRGEVSALGSVLDIGIDRVVENVFWIAFLDLKLVPVWIPLVVITRGILTDAVRGFALSRGLTAFGMMETPWGRWLVSGRFMRGLYGTLKAIVFCALAGLLGLQELWANTPNARWLPLLETIVFILVLLTVTITVARGVPVLVEARRFFAQPDLAAGD